MTSAPDETTPNAPDGSGPGPLVSAAWLMNHLDEGDVRVVHVSVDAEAYGRGHVPGAVFSDLHVDLAHRGHAPETGEVEREYLLPDHAAVTQALVRWGVAAGDRVVFYDDAGRNRYAVRGVWLLRHHGWPRDRVHVLDGGLRAWKDAGGPVTDDVPPARERAAVPHLGPGDPSVTATAEEVLTWIAETGEETPPRLLDVRTEDEYRGRDVRARRGGHIPGAVRLEWTEFLGPDDPFRSPGEIRRLVDDATGGTSDALRATYCQGGVRAALAWFALSELAGLPVRNYAGSWEEWGNRDDTPVATD